MEILVFGVTGVQMVGTSRPTGAVDELGVLLSDLVGTLDGGQAETNVAPYVVSRETTCIVFYCRQTTQPILYQ